MGFARARAGGFVLLTTGLSCSLLTNLDGLSGGSAATDAADAPSSDDGTITDGGSTDEATADAADAGRFCARLSPAPAFCADFDEEPAVDVGWTRVDVGEGGSLTVDNAAATSRPSSMLVKIKRPAGGCSYARLIRDFTPDVPSREIHLAYDLLIDDSADSGTYPGGEITMAAILVSGADASTGCSYYLQFTDPSVANAFVENEAHTSTDSVPLTRRPRPGQWTRVGIDVVGGGGIPTFAVTLDGLSALDPQAAIASCATGGPLQISAGLLCVGAGPSDPRVHIDNVVLTTK